MTANKADIRIRCIMCKRTNVARVTLYAASKKSPDDKERVLSGLCPECRNKMFEMVAEMEKKYGE